MTAAARPDIIAPELIACIANGREPSVHELFSVACRVWTAGSADRSAIDWDRLQPTNEDRIRALRVARAALAGSGDQRA